MEEKDKLLEKIKELKKNQLTDKIARFNELAKEIGLKKEEYKTYPKESIEELDASIQSLRILKGRINQMKEITGNPEYKGDPNSAFFGLAPPKPKPDAEEKPDEVRFNTIQLFDYMKGPSRESEKYDNDCFIVRLYENPVDTLGRKI